MSDQRLALIITMDHDDPLSSSQQSRASPVDMRQAADLVDVLGDPDLGDFDVTVLSNATSWEIAQHVDDLLVDRDASDVVLMYFIGRGLVTADGGLYLAATDTRPGHLMATAVDAGWILTLMRDGHAGSVTLILDCPFLLAGGTAEGINIDRHLECNMPVGGPYRAVITATTRVDPPERAGDLGSPAPSGFTFALVDAIRTGGADRDRHGVVTLDDLYDHVQDRLRVHAPDLTPRMTVHGQPRRLLIVDAPPGIVKPAPSTELGASANPAATDSDPTVAKSARRTSKSGPPVPPEPVRPGETTIPPGDKPRARKRRRPLIFAGVAAAAVVTIAITLQIANHPKVPMRVTIVRALAASSDKVGVVPLLAAQQDQAPEVRNNATDGLTTLLRSLPVTDAVTALLAAQHNQPPEVSDNATKALTTLLSSRPLTDAVTALTAAIEDERVTVRGTATTTLVKYANSNIERTTATVAKLLQAQVPQNKAAWMRDADARALTALVYGQSPALAVSALAAAFADPTIAPAATTTLQQYVTTISHASDTRASETIVPLLQVQADPAGAQAARDTATQSLAGLLAAMADDRAVAGLLAATRAQTVAAGADATLRQYLAGIGPDRAAAAVLTASAGDAWLAVALGVPPEQLATETRRRGIQLDPPALINSTATLARAGQPIPGTHPYQPSDGYHPAVLLSAGAGPLDAPSAQWAPTAVRFLELVVVIDQINRTGEQIETCDYQPNDPTVPAGSITRYHMTQTVRVISTTDAHIVAEQTFKGADPDTCHDVEVFPQSFPNITRVGDPPDLTAATPWLESIIHPPATGGG
jgi:hypothetical protein